MSVTVPAPRPEVPARELRHPVLSVMLHNALLLSLIYLVAGVGLELLRLVYPMPWVETASVVLDSLPARLLHELEVLGPLTKAAAYGEISGVWLRVIFSTLTIGIIFVLAGAVALVMLLIAKLVDRRRGA